MLESPSGQHIFLLRYTLVILFFFSPQYEIDHSRITFYPTYLCLALLFGIPSTLHESSIHTPKVLIGGEVQAEASGEDESLDRCKALWIFF